MSDKIISISVEYQEVVKDFDRLKNEIVQGGVFYLDGALDKAVDDLKNTLSTIINKDIKAKVTPTLQPSSTDITDNISKTKNDIINYLFNEDISKSDYLRKDLGSKTVNDNSNIFMVKNGLLKAWQGVNETSTYSGEEFRFRDRLIKGIIIDEDRKKIIKFNPNTIKSVKLECSKDSGETLNSTKKFEAYKSSNRITRRKESGSDLRVAVWTIKKEDLNLAIKDSISIDTLIENIQNKNFSEAKQLINKINKNGEYNSTLEKIDNINKNKNITPELETINAINKLIKNLKIEKRVDDKITTYTLFSTYDDLAESHTSFFEELRKNILIWQIRNEDKWMGAIIKGIIKVLNNYSNSPIVK